MNYTANQPVMNPSAFISSGKNRLKQFGGAVYMSDNQEFEIELYNPKRSPVLAKIKLNGTYISSTGIIIKPGQRVFLERFLDSNNKFVFSTYEVSGNSQEVKDAIANNGDVEIEFYDEYIPPITINTNTWYNNVWYNNGARIKTFTPCDNDIKSVLRSRKMNNPSYDVTCYYNNSLGDNSTVSMDSLGFMEPELKTTKSIETGRVEQGGTSKQEFTYVNGNYNNWVSTKVIWKILPKSQQPIEAKDLRKFCTECGTKQKESNKFCPNCGTKVN